MNLYAIDPDQLTKALSFWDMLEGKVEYDLADKVVYHPSGVAIVPVSGVLSFDRVCTEYAGGGSGGGSCSYRHIAAVFKALATDPTVEQVLLVLDSPGGTVQGIAEAAEALIEFRQAKSVTAFTDSVCTSGAYWLASLCNGIVATPSAIVGSIGVVSSVYKQGESPHGKVYVFAKEKDKVFGSPYSDMTEEEAEYHKSRCADIYDDFANTVAVARRLEISKVYALGSKVYFAKDVVGTLVDEVTTKEVM